MYTNLAAAKGYTLHIPDHIRIRAIDVAMASTKAPGQIKTQCLAKDLHPT